MGVTLLVYSFLFPSPDLLVLNSEILLPLAYAGNRIITVANADISVSPISFPY